MLVKMPWAVPTVLRSPEGEGAGGTGGGEGGDPGSKPNDGADKQVPLSTHKEILDKFHAANNQVKTLQAEMEKLRNDMKAAGTKTKEESGDFKNLYEQVKTEKAELEQKYTEFKSSVHNNERFRSLETELKKRGLKEGNESILDFVDLEKMPTEATSRGRILVHGIEEVAAELQKKYAFAFSQKAPNFNDRGGNTDVHGDIPDSQLTADFMVALEKKDPQKYKALYPRYVKAWQERQLKGG